MRADSAGAARAGFDGYLEKPVSLACAARSGRGLLENGGAGPRRTEPVTVSPSTTSPKPTLCSTLSWRSRGHAS